VNWARGTALGEDLLNTVEVGPMTWPNTGPDPRGVLASRDVSPTPAGSLVCGSQWESTMIQVLIQVTSIVRVSVEYGWVSLCDVACHMDSVFLYPHVFQRHGLLSRFVILKCGSSKLP
jgi:hypothetical protein